MSEALALAVAWITGALLGAIFFGGLWWTVRRGVSSARPALWFVCSLVARMNTVLGGFYIVSKGHWQRGALCLVGFVTASLFTIRLTRPSRSERGRSEQEAAHAP
jgi:F1F0 ATPase subunit 2